MAKAKVKGLEEAIDSIFKRYNSNLKKAMEDAARKAEEDINRKADSCLAQYYFNYSPNHGEPNWYERTNSLELAFVKVNETIQNKKDITTRVGVMYDPSRLDGVYNSEASDKPFFNPVDPTWVLKNYLAGIHPRTNGWPLYGDELIYDPIQDKDVPDTIMQNYIEKYKDTFDQNVLKWFARRVTRR